MVLVVLLAVALIAAPAIAQNGETTNDSGPPPGETTGGSYEAPFLKEEPSLPESLLSVDTAPDAPPSVVSVPEPSLPEILTRVEEPAPVIGDNTNTGPSDAATSTDTGGVTNTDTGSDVGDGPGNSTRNDILEALDEEVDAEDIEDQVVGRAIDVDAKDREDRIADKILAQLRDDKKDRDDEDKDEDNNDDADKDDVEQSQDQDADSGDVDQDADVINTGDNVNQCVGILQVANTGNAQNATGVTQYDSEADEIELENGSRITLTPQLVVDCRQIILQIVRGERHNESKISKARLREVVRPTSGATLANQTGAGVIVPSSRSGITATPKVLSASSAGRPAGQPRNSARSLPRTGGSYATLLGLGTGALLVGGGLLVRRLAR
jgi:hypothetical protein